MARFFVIFLHVDPRVRISRIFIDVTKGCPIQLRQSNRIFIRIFFVHNYFSAVRADNQIIGSDNYLKVRKVLKILNSNI